jgi:hypothetical protein
MGKRDGEQQSQQTNAEGQHGDKTHEAFLEGLRGSEESEGAQRSREADEYGRPVIGKHRLDEGRQQHDEADKNSEANKLERNR